MDERKDKFVSEPKNADIMFDDSVIGKLKDGLHPLAEISQRIEDRLSVLIEGTTIQSYRFREMPQLGAFSFSIKEASEIIVIDMYYSEKYADDKSLESISNLDIEDIDMRNSLVEKLDKHIQDMCTYLVNSIVDGDLRASRTRKSFDGKININETYIESDELKKWLSERNYDTGDYFFECINIRDMMLDSICKQFAWLHIAKESGIVKVLDIMRSWEPKRQERMGFDFEELHNAWKMLVLENDRLKSFLYENKNPEKAGGIDPPVHTRAKRTLLVIIAALCQKSGIDFSARGASRRIRESIELLGFSIGDETIKKILDEIPDALTTRSK